MALGLKYRRALVVRLIVGLALLGWTRIASATGTWSVIADAGKGLGQVYHLSALAADASGNLYVADMAPAAADIPSGRLQQCDNRGHWSVLASQGSDLGQVSFPTALAVTPTGELYIADDGNGWRIQKRDAQGHWSLVATMGSAPGQVDWPSALAVDASGDLFVADGNNGRFQKRDAQGHWTVIGAKDPGTSVPALAADSTGNLYVAELPCSICLGSSHIEKRDVQGNSSVIADFWGYLAVDSSGNLYVGSDEIQKRDSQGNWSVVAYDDDGLGRVSDPNGLAVDGAGNLYVADGGNNRILQFAPSP